MNLRNSKRELVQIITKYTAAILLWLALLSMTGNVLASSSATLAMLLLFDWSDRDMSVSPKALLTISYVVFILVGALFFDAFKSVSFDDRVMDGIYIGFISLALGILTSQWALARTVAHDSPIGSYYLMQKGMLHLLLIISGLSYLVLIAMSGIPLFSSDPDSARLAFTAGKGHIAIFYKAAPIICVALVIDAIASGDFRRLRRAHVIVGVVAFSSLLTGARGATGQIILSYFMAWAIVADFRPKIVHVYGAVLTGICAMSVIGAIRRFGSISLDNALFELSIILTARPAALRLIDIKLQNFEKFGIGAYFTDLGKLLPGISSGQNVVVKDLIFGNSSRLSEGAGINPSIIGEAIINLGGVGPYIVPFLVGVLGYTLFKKSLKKSGSFFWVATYSFFVSEAFIGISSGLAPRITGFVISFFWIVTISPMFKASIKFANRST